MQLVNQRLRTAWPSWWPERNLQEIVQEVEGNIEKARIAWGLTLTGRIDHGWVAVVLEAENRHGEKFILKASPYNHTGKAEAKLAEVIPQHIPLRGQRDQGMTMLLEKAAPGTRLSEKDAKQRALVCGQIAREIQAVQSDLELPEYRQLIETARQAARQKNLPDALKTGEEAAEALMGRPQGLCHGDLHGDNLLLHKGKWAVIDAKGSYGPLAFECLEIVGPPQVKPGEIEAQVQSWAEAAELDEREAWIGVAARAWYQAARAQEDGEAALQARLDCYLGQITLAEQKADLLLSQD